MKRKIIQIENNGGPTLALCNDGSLFWYAYNRSTGKMEWEDKLPEIPQPEKEENDSGYVDREYLHKQQMVLDEAIEILRTLQRLHEPDKPNSMLSNFLREFDTETSHKCPVNHKSMKEDGWAYCGFCHEELIKEPEVK